MAEHDNSENGVAGEIVAFEDTSAKIALAGGHTVLWPIKLLPTDCAIGTRLRLEIKTTSDTEADTKKTAKLILNEILGNG